MRLNMAIKAALCITSAALIFQFSDSTAQAQENAPIEESLAGFSHTMDNYLKAVALSTQEDSNEIVNLSIKDLLPRYTNLGVSKAKTYVNIRKEPSTESDIVGKLYRGNAANILEYLEGDWVRIESGNVEGYIASNYLAINDEAEDLIDEYAEKYATVTTQTLKVRAEQSTESKVLELIPGGETFPVLEEYEEWVKILLAIDDSTGDEFTGYVHKDYVDIEVEFKYAISIEEEREMIRKQQEAERAEAERKRKLAEEKAKREEEARKKAEAQKKAEQEKKNQNQNGSKNNNSSSENITYSGDVSKLQREIVEYALKFVGNPYVWGGESLTRGADCSGFVQTIYADFGFNIPRVSKDQAVNAGRKVSLSEIQPGDLIFYTNSYGTVNHVAMYIGNGKIVHASNKREGIKISAYNYREIYRVRRIVN